MTKKKLRLIFVIISVFIVICGILYTIIGHSEGNEYSYDSAWWIAILISIALPIVFYFTHDERSSTEIFAAKRLRNLKKEMENEGKHWAKNTDEYKARAKVLADRYNRNVIISRSILYSFILFWGFVLIMICLDYVNKIFDNNSVEALLWGIVLSIIVVVGLVGFFMKVIKKDLITRRLNKYIDLDINKVLDDDTMNTVRQN